MTFTNPVAWWLGLLALPIIALHILRPRRHARTVSSTFLWRELAQPVTAASPWQRLRPSTLLFLQLLAVALLAGAAARPVRLTDAPLAQHTVFIIDSSGSMAALDGDPERLDIAKRRAKELRDELPSGGLASLVEAGTQPRVLLSSSGQSSAFDEAVNSIESTTGAANLTEAFTLAMSLEAPGVPIGFVLLSDGRLSDGERRLIPPGTRYEPIGKRSTNRAITALSVEPRGAALVAHVTVRNTGGPRARQTLRLDVDGRTKANVEVDLEPGGVVQRDIDLPMGDRVEARLEGEDLLSADDVRRSVVGRRKALKVLVAGPDNMYLDALLASLPGITVERSPTSREAAGFDLVIYDQVVVPANPGAPVLAIAPPGGMPGISVTGMAEGAAVTLVRSDDPLLVDLDLSEVAVGMLQRLAPNPGDEVLLGAEGLPLLVRGERAGQEFVYLAFALDQSNLAVQVAFPILGDRLVSELAGSTRPPTALEVGDALPVRPGVEVLVEGPGATEEIARPGLAVPVADRPGFWLLSEDGRPAVTVAVNVAVSESSIAPVDVLAIEPRGAKQGERVPRGESSLLAWVVGVILLVLLVETWLSARRMGVGRKQRRLAFAARVVVGALLVGALAGFAIPRTRNRVATTFLIDASHSLGSGGRADAVRWVQDALAKQPRGSLAGVVLFGGDARLELTLQEQATLLNPTVKVDANRTNLATAIRLAGAVLPSDARRRIVLLSDGRATEGDAIEEARRLRETGIEVDVHTVGRSGTADVAVVGLDAPTAARQGEKVPLRATLRSSKAGLAEVRLKLDGAQLEARTVELVVGDNIVEFAHVLTDAGLARYQVEVVTGDDSVVENNTSFAAVQVDGPAKVLIAEGAEGNGAKLAVALRAGGIEADIVGASVLPPLDVLSRYASVVLVDVDLLSLAAAQVDDLTVATRDLGRGLLVMGGTHSYGVGGYLGSKLEQLLPVVSDVLDPKRRRSVAQVMAVDSSGSMGACHCAEGQMGGLPSGRNQLMGGITKTDIARSAAARTIEAMGPNDEIGVLAFNTEHRWLIDLQKLPSEEVVRKGLGKLSPAGGTNLRTPLGEAADALRKSKAQLKHIILFTDGFTDPGSLSGLAEEAATLLNDEGITTSVLATGEGSARELREVAEAGGGRFYPGRDLDRIPQIMMEEAIMASRDFINEGEFLPKVVSSTGPVANMTSSPPLLGFVATTAKPTARTLLRIGDDDDPLLVSWQAGLGNVTSWTSDGGQRWAQTWSGWNQNVEFWSGVIKDTFPESTSGAGSARARVNGDQLEITVEGSEVWPDGATATARVAGPDRTSNEVSLDRVSGTTFAADVATSDPGIYAVGVRG